MAYDDRKKIIEKIEKERGGRRLISLCNFDRNSIPPLSGLNMQFDADLKECLFRILKETYKDKKGLDIFLYTRGGDTNSVWPIISLLKEYDEHFEILIPFRAHSAGTLFALGANKIEMTKLAELSPIDPSTGNQFNPIDPINNKNRLGISVEDLNAYKEFIKETFYIKKESKINDNELKILENNISALTKVVHPLAIGNVFRVHNLIKKLAKKLLKYKISNEKEIDEIINRLTVEPYSHLHMINRKEAKEILGDDFVSFASEKLEQLLDELLKKYEDDFNLREPLFLSRLMNDKKNIEDVRFIGGLVEASNWGYLFETEAKVYQYSKIPNNVNVQIPAGQPMPLVPGLPKEYRVEINQQRWYHNVKPKGITK